MKNSQAKNDFVVCVKNDGYEASLELRKVYQILPSESVVKNDLVCIIDESGEDYLYPQDFFAPIQLPKVAEHLFTQAS